MFDKKLSFLRYGGYRKALRSAMASCHEGDPCVSVIVPVFNRELVIEECLQSVLGQSLEHIEVICIDDGSTDGSLRILKELAIKDARLRIIQQENQGAAAARNRGMQEAQGRYLSFLDADDVFDEDMLLLATAEAERSKADFVVFRSDRFVDDFEQRSPIPWSLRSEWLPKRGPFAWRDIKGNTFKAFIGWAWDKLFRREFIERHGLRFQEQRTTNDMLFVFSALVLARRISVVGEVLAHQRRSTEGTLSVTREESWDCFYHALVALRDRLRKEELYEDLEVDFINYALHACLWNVETLEEPARSMLLAQLEGEWLEDLGIAGKEPGYFQDEDEYQRYIALFGRNNA